MNIPSDRETPHTEMLLENLESPTPHHLRHQLMVEFYRFVGKQIGQEALPQPEAEDEPLTPWNRLSAMPDFLLPTEEINPAWVTATRTIHRRTFYTPDGQRDSPGKLSFSPSEGWQAVDSDSPIGKIASLQRQARALQDAKPEKTKSTQREIRQELSVIFNDYAGKRFNGVREVVNGNDFGGVTIRNMAYRSLLLWRERLIRVRAQAVIPELFDRWEGWQGDPTKIRTPSRVDDFFLSLFRTLGAGGESEALRLFRQLTHLPQAFGYRAIANAFYGGDMFKARLNLAALAQAAGVASIANWQGFNGSTAEFRKLQKQIDHLESGAKGYLKAADDEYDGDMKKTFLNYSAVAQLLGRQFPGNWQAFHGSTEKFREIQRQFPKLGTGISGYLTAADELYEGDMRMTYIGVSAVAHTSGLPFPIGWQKFDGTIRELLHLLKQFDSLKGGTQGLLIAAEKLYDGKIQKTYRNVSAVAQMTGRSMFPGWRFRAKFPDRDE